MPKNQEHTEGWACTDCMMLLCNGETPPEMDEEQTAIFVAYHEDAGDVTPGRHTDDCGCDDWNTDKHRDECEREEFSSRRCDICRRPNNAGERHAVTFSFPAAAQS